LLVASKSSFSYKPALLSKDNQNYLRESKFAHLNFGSVIRKGKITKPYFYFDVLMVLHLCSLCCFCKRICRCFVSSNRIKLQII
jgi:hypothetical protein